MGENSWVVEVNDKVNRLPDITRDEEKAWQSHSIYKLPACVTDLVTDRKESVYKPRAISFGPYHYGESNLDPMEAHKERALLHFIERSGNPLEHYRRALSGVVKELKDAYDSLDDKWKQDSEAFLKLMIRDGCFMLEVLRSSSTDLTKNGYASNDPIFSKHGMTYMLPYIKRDMLMLENQLPMLLLRKLHAIYKQDAQTSEESADLLEKSIERSEESAQGSEESVDKLILKFYSHSHSHSSTPPELDKCLHILDAYRTILLWKDSATKTQESTQHCKVENNSGEILSARELEESGISIKKSKSTSLTDIQFDCKWGILKLPPICMDDVSETMFLNLIAFERFHAGAGSQVTNYIYLMDKLVDNAKDVNILQSHEILHNALGSDKALAQLINSLSKDVVLDRDSSLNKVHVAINSYCKTKPHKWRASLIQTYFRNPWASVSVMAAIVLFALTIVQALYGALQYYQALNSSPSPPPPPRPPPSHRS
ncbi:UPF0481 protein At3g47200-like isoform X1 [Coffea eugenioides]|uniref:UPF0481 protein At3g47200-like isoform X1 n=1 Tax=Coffea arabica TaxID=13443 RepID=A0A6P6TQR0_COFAR|nr:UPF0481 protein At3g47200-like isoform X1 [Coffea arabica]XP_027183071.1 UPF0481 protein At3g47200-like isoform X1 [Coffea eugenioides]